MNNFFANADGGQTRAQRTRLEYAQLAWGAWLMFLGLAGAATATVAVEPALALAALATAVTGAVGYGVALRLRRRFPAVWRHNRLRADSAARWI